LKENGEYLGKVRRCLEQTLKVASVAVKHISDKAIEEADKLSKLKFVGLIHPARGARFTP